MPGNILFALSLCRKAGALVMGFDAVKDSVGQREGTTGAVRRRPFGQGTRRRVGAFCEDWVDGGGPARNPVRPSHRSAKNPAGVLRRNRPRACKALPQKPCCPRRPTRRRNVHVSSHQIQTQRCSKGPQMSRIRSSSIFCIRRWATSKKHTSPLTEAELNHVFEHYTQKNSEASLDAYLAQRARAQGGGKGYPEKGRRHRCARSGPAKRKERIRPAKPEKAEQARA